MVALIQQRLTTPVQLPALLLASVLIAGLLSAQGPDDRDGYQGIGSASLYYLFWLCHSLIGLLLMSGVTRVLSNILPTTLLD